MTVSFYTITTKKKSSLHFSVSLKCKMLIRLNRFFFRIPNIHSLCFFSPISSRVSHPGKPFEGNHLLILTFRTNYSRLVPSSTAQPERGLMGETRENRAINTGKDEKTKEEGRRRRRTHVISPCSLEIRTYSKGY